MKIDNHRTQLDAALQAERTDGVKRAETDAAGRAAARGGDAVTLSSTAQLAARAVAAAGPSDDLRAEEIARGKKLLASGALGQDAEHLADVLLERILETN
jgi:flagellar biosynthesis anti-sigma factor FlgM